MMSTKIYKKNNFFSFSLNLRKLRKAKEITIEQFANDLSLNFETVKNYEGSNTIPPLQTLIRIASYFGVSIDFLLFWDKTPYVHSVKLLTLSSKIDKLDQVKKFQIESTANSLLIDKQEAIQSKLDPFDSELTPNFHKNIKFFRNKYCYSQKQLANKLGVSKAQIFFYETKSIPKPMGLLQLSTIFNISIHALTTGKILNIPFNDQPLKETILKADKLLSLKEKIFYCDLMEKILKQ